MKTTRQYSLGWVMVMTVLAMGTPAALAAEKTDAAASPADKQLVLYSFKAAAPLLDGKLDDACWGGAQKAVGFMPQASVQAAAVDTTVMSCYDDTTLYLAARADEPAMDSLSTREHIWNGDSFEIFLCPEPTSNIYYHLLVGARGAVMVYRHTPSGLTSIDVPITAKTHLGSDFWSAEIAVPFASFNAAMPEDNQRWTFNIGRNRLAGGELQHLTWAYLGVWTEWARLGQMAFTSQADIDADMEYWRNAQRDPLMRRAEVSGVKIANVSDVRNKLPDLWSYYPFEADRGEPYRNGYFYSVGLSRKFHEENPACYDAAMGINDLLIAKSLSDDRLSQLKRIVYFAQHTDGLTGVDPAAVDGTLAGIVKESGAINEGLNAAYQTYGAAFRQDKDPNAMVAMMPQVAALTQRLAGHDRAIAALSATLTAAMHRVCPWQAQDLRYEPGQTVTNARGLNTRLQYIWYSYSKDRQALIAPLVPTYDAVRVDWPTTIPDGGKDKADASLEQWTFNNLKDSVKALEISPTRRLSVNPTLAVHQFPLCKELIDAIKDNNNDILDVSCDGYAPDYTAGHYRSFGSVGNLNWNNPTFLSLVDVYVKDLAAALRDVKVTPMLLLSAWEGNYPFYIEVPDAEKKGYRQQRLPGYNPTQRKAFVTYLQERYDSLDDLNARWHTDYAAFDAIEPPMDKNIVPAQKASGLTYEFERFMRVNYMAYQAKLKSLYHENIPGAAVMPDPSKLLTEGNVYLMYKYGIGDYMSFHSNPGFDEVLWTYFGTMNRAFGNVTGVYEHYHGMYGRMHLNDERLAKRDLGKMFFAMFAHDVRLSTWWVSSMSHPTMYVAAYNNNACYLDYHQTIYRWSMTQLPVMFLRSRAIEKALVESAPEVPVTAIIQPCATVFNFASMGATNHTSPPLVMMADLHNAFLKPANLPHDYLPEEMVLDGMASLDQYKVLFLPDAPYMSEAFSVQLMQWVKNGGTLAAFGPFALMDPYGNDLPAEKSLFRTVFGDYRKTGDGYFDYSVTGGDAPDAASVVKRSIGTGTLIALNRPSSTYTQDPTLKEQFATELAALEPLKPAHTDHADLELHIRSTDDGTRYLCACNRNVGDPLTAAVTINGTYSKALDIVVDGWVPAPTTVRDGATTIDIRLDPGEWTVIQLVK